MSIYRLYLQNGNQAGFWIQHRRWQNVCAQVQAIAGQREGALPVLSQAQAPPDVVAQHFDVRSGRRIDMDPVLSEPEGHGYVLIAEPAWSRRRLRQTRPSLPTTN